MKRYQIAFYAGYGLDKNGNSIPAANAARAITNIESRAAELFGGVTITRSSGVWKCDDEVIIEPSLVISSVTTQMHDLNSFADFIKAELNQASVLVTVTELANYFFA